MSRAVLVGCALLFLGACGAPGAPHNSPPAPKVSRITVTPNSLLMTGKGDTHQLKAQAFDDRGNLLDVPLSWAALDPDVAVGQGGEVTSLIDLGSSQVVARAEGVSSSPVMITVAQPTEGAILINDAQIASEFKILNPEVEAGVGTRYQVTLAGITPPEPGQILLARESAPLAGRVVSAEAVASGIQVTLELVPINDLFERISVDEILDLSAGNLELEATLPFQRARNADGGVSLIYTAEGDLATEALELDCESGGEGFFSPNLLKVDIANKLRLRYAFQEMPSGETERLEIVLDGEHTIEVSGGLFLEAGFKGEVVCKLILARIPIPITGAFAAGISPTLALGAEVRAEGSVKAVRVEAGIKGKVGTTTQAGITYTSTGGLKHIMDVDLIRELKPILEMNSVRDMRVEIGLFAGALASLDVTILRLDRLSASLVEGRAGLRADASLAFIDSQAFDQGYASNYDIKLRGEIGLGNIITKLLETFKIKQTGTSLDVKHTFDSPPLASSPRGQLTVDRTQADIGDTIRFTVDLDPDSVSFPLYGYNVDEVRLYYFKDGQAPRLLHSFEMSQSGQTRFTHDWIVPRDHDGDYHVTAFVSSFVIPEVALEVEADSSKTITIGGACRDMPSDPGAPTNPTEPGAPSGPGQDGNIECTGGALRTESWHTEDLFEPGTKPKEIGDGSYTLRATDFEIVRDPDGSNELTDSYVVTSVKVSYRLESTSSTYGADGQLAFTCNTTIAFEGVFEDPNGLGYITVYKQDMPELGLAKGMYSASVGVGDETSEATVTENCHGPLKDLAIPLGPTTPFGAVVLAVPFPGEPDWDAFGPFLIPADGTMRGEILTTQENSRCRGIEFDVLERRCTEEWNLVLPGAGDL